MGEEGKGGFKRWVAGGVGMRLVTQVLRMKAGSTFTLCYFHFVLIQFKKVLLLLTNKSESTVHRKCVLTS